jgi:hypothetical protein
MSLGTNEDNEIIHSERGLSIKGAVAIGCGSIEAYSGKVFYSRDLSFSTPRNSIKKSRKEPKKNYCTITYIYAIIIKLILFSKVALLKSSIVLLFFLPCQS